MFRWEGYSPCLVLFADACQFVRFAALCHLLSYIYSHSIFLHSFCAVIVEDLPVSFGLNIYHHLFSKHVNHCRLICLKFLF